MNFFGIGLPEMAVIAAIGLLVFGPKRLPELGKTLGRTLRGFQSASQEFEKEFRTAITAEGSGRDADEPTSIQSAVVEPPLVEPPVVEAAAVPPLPAVKAGSGDSPFTSAAGSIEAPAAGENA
jgi:sec-independent protein translocase protein TatA